MADYESRSYWESLIRMSLSKFFVLRVLYTEAFHGYELAKKVNHITGGCCSPSEGSIYPILKEFEKKGLVAGKLEEHGGRERKVYQLTAKGREVFHIALDAWREIMAHLNTSTKDL